MSRTGSADATRPETTGTPSADKIGIPTAWYAEGVDLVKAVESLDEMVVDQMELLSVTP